MKSKLVINLIKSYSESEDSFNEAVEKLAEDEEKKGNRLIASEIRKSYQISKSKKNKTADRSVSDMVFSVQNAGVLPRDKDSALELIDIHKSKIKLDDVALPTPTLKAIKQVLIEQKSLEELIARGVQPSNRILLCGPPGCGKTMTANAIAGELNLPIAYVKLDALVSSYLGQTGTNIRKIFEFIKDKRLILFLDEFDAIAKKRDDAQELGELKRVVTTLLQNLDMMNSNVLLLAATNHHHLLDSAVWRRFNKSILLEKPEDDERMKIIENYLSKVLSNYETDKKTIQILSKEMSGAQLKNFLDSIAKYVIIERYNKEIDKEIIGKVWLEQKLLFVSKESQEYYSVIKELKDNGLSLRMLEQITGIPKSTIDYNLKKGESNE
ncbi:AAA family ATPase [uncultured Anaerococcus sp.]|uniref:AAA family ATPase n=1 Tax=uncultured Anaerococcus sp. TaxID=293428 RepID=UPI00288917E7|nr:AAA family ATPase [uncultured Anaerococcus sp.]